MKTTHQLAKELLTLPDVQLVVEYWIMMDSTHEIVAEMTKYDPKNTAIIWQKPNNAKSAKRGYSKSTRVVFREPVERALCHLTKDNFRMCKKWLLWALNLIEVKKQRDCSYTYKSTPTKCGRISNTPRCACLSSSP